jgi:hypothetical protein
MYSLKVPPLVPAHPLNGDYKGGVCSLFKKDRSPYSREWILTDRIPTGGTSSNRAMFLEKGGKKIFGESALLERVPRTGPHMVVFKKQRPGGYPGLQIRNQLRF